MMGIQKLIVLFLGLVFEAGVVFGQQHILYFTNGSFEGERQDAVVPSGWNACELGTTPDILPGFWGVYQEASDGDTYVGLITRGDGSWESIGQRLSHSLKLLECYKFTVDLAQSKTYADYNEPVRLMIWGGSGRCNKEQLLFQSKKIDHNYWKTYEVKFNVKVPINYIIFEAYFEEKGKVVRGNILIDNLSPIKMCPRA